MQILRPRSTESRVAAIDLAEIELVDRDAVMLLADTTKSTGIELRTLPGLHPRSGFAKERGRN